MLVPTGGLHRLLAVRSSVYRLDCVVDRRWFVHLAQLPALSCFRASRLALGDIQGIAEC